MSEALAPHERPFVADPIDTAALPDTPQRDYRIPATVWVSAPDALLRLGDDLDEPVEYKRRIGSWLLWRAGPPMGEARYMAVAPDLSETFIFELHGKAGEGRGPDGKLHQRFRTWKESLRDVTPGGDHDLR